METTITLSQIDIERLPNYRRKTHSGEYSSACPVCGGSKRFLFWTETGNYWCRECGLKGFVSDKSSPSLFTPEQYESWKRAEELRKLREQRQQQQNIDSVASTRAELRYHQQMTDRSYWYEQGLTDATIDKYLLGYCPACPTYPTSPSWTIPIFHHDKLYNIRHRLVRPDKGGKYRPERPGLPAMIFNADVLDAGDWMVVLVEGEVKAMVLQQHGFSTVGIPGASSFKDEWAKFFNIETSTVYIALDPGAEEQAKRLAQTLLGNGIKVRICSMPAKPDDMIVKYRATERDMFGFLILGKKP